MDRGDDFDPSHHLQSINKHSNKRLRPHAPRQAQQHPSVYYVHKNDFRELVQMLTGSVSHNRVLSNPSISFPHVLQPQPTSRIHQIRHPPLVQINPIPPPMMTPCAYQPTSMSSISPLNGANTSIDSAISAYIMYLQSTTVTDPPLINPLNFEYYSPPKRTGFPIQPISPISNSDKRDN